MEEIGRKKKVRGGHRSYATRLIAQVAAAVEEKDVRKLKNLDIQLKDRNEMLGALDVEILDGISQHVEEDGDEACGQEIEEAGMFQERMNDALIAIEDVLNEARPLVRANSNFSVDSLASGETSQCSSGIKKVRARLPKLELQKFSGKPEDWQEFWDGFRSAVDDNDEISTVDKFSYLKYYLQEPAKKVLAGLELTERNYSNALEILQQRFAKPTIIRRAHINQLVNAPIVFSEKNTARLRELYDVIETHYRGLEALGVDRTSYSAIVVPTLMDKIPDAVRLNMIRGARAHDDWELNEMLDAFREELEIRERHVPMFTSEAKTRPMEKRAANQHQTSASALHTTTEEKKCAFCMKNHAEEACETVKDIGERKKLISKFGRCFSCLAKGHRAFKCRSKFNCRLCGGRHHTSICEGPKDKDSKKESDAFAKKDSTLSPSAPSFTSANVSTCVGNVECGGSIALQTAQALVNGRKDANARVRVLFDSGSHKSFITTKPIFNKKFHI